MAAASGPVSTTPVKAKAHTTKKIVELSPWEQAERGRVALEALPEAKKTRVQYTRAMNGYRAIYHAKPGDMHAADSVYAVAELLTEQGQALRDAKSLREALAQYEFLRKQYPGSSLRVKALLAEARINEADLNDARAARTQYTQVSVLYPRSESAEEARAALAEMNHAARESAVAKPADVNEVVASATRAAEKKPAAALRPMRNWRW